MSDDEYHPELAEYVPGDRDSVRRPLTMKLIRVVIVIAVVALILPGVISTISVQVETAGAACAIVVAATAPDSTPDARLQLWGGNGPGWYCYARAFDGSEVLLRALGMIPGLTYRPSGTPA
ncbi:MAG TPA: hypothetical protein VFQ74_10240 [Pseudolysinimonas sp.]|nr:hypothetical protein [Pseudolysinimonas sp.]